MRRSPARGRATDYWLNLAFLDPEPVRIQERIWLIGAAASAVAALAAWLLQGSASSEPVATGLAVLIPIAMVTAAGSLGIGLPR